MRTSATIRIIIFFGALLFRGVVHPQNSENSTTIVTQWDNPLAVVPGTIVVNGEEMAAHTFTIHGTNANTLYKMWRSDMREKTREISGRRPAVAKGVAIPGISSQPLTVIAEAHGERKEPFARMTIALAQNDSTPLANEELQRQYATELAVRYNQMLIDEAIAERQRELAKAERKNDRSGSNEQKLRKRLDRAEARLEKTRKRRQKAEAAKAEKEGEVMGYQRALNTTNTDRDGRRVIRARREVAKKEADVLKYMERELEYEAQIKEYQQELPEYARSQAERSDEIQKLEQEINALESAKENLQP